MKHSMQVMTKDTAAQVCADVFKTDVPILQYAGNLEAGSTEDHDKLKILGHTFYRIGEEVVYTESDIIFKIDEKVVEGETITKGTSYVVYLDKDGEVYVKIHDTSADLKIETIGNKAVKLIGGFHTICRTVAVTQKKAPYAAFGNTLHELAGWSEGDILPLSVWALNFRPTADDPSAMVYIRSLDLWVDVYNASGSIAAPKSKFGGVRIHTKCQTEFITGFANVGKILLDDTEFFFAAVGSNCGTKVKGEAQPNPDTTGGHLDTANYPMISSVGCDECCGLQNQWLRNEVSAANGSWDQASTPTKCYDGGNNTFGAVYNALNWRALYAGGTWTTGTVVACGPFYRFGNNLRSFVLVAIGGRGSSRSLGTNKNL